ncbi:3'5'-cyclic nucleotide phosphodiesterase [Nitzschia inconspicua]|uniref:3'5'-cyclic nucleotide phosphodiesterase n=1 Tax=Nitzschia inconspicua TaxID=303405 RepID=A0A9K3KZC7_9STRA|nr:3'5'-cyclic nucleotide phosphodiesterase [Nitzschia inconspicua]
MYPTSIAEHHSLELASQLLHQDCYHQLRRAIYSTVAEFEHFRQMLVNSVLVTDMMDKELQNERKDRWKKVFQNDTSKLTAAEQKNLINLQKTAVLETVIQVSDVSHTMHHCSRNALPFTHLVEHCFCMPLATKRNGEPRARKVLRNCMGCLVILYLLEGVKKKYQAAVQDY